MHSQRNTINGFTLIELLVVVSIIGLLIALLLPALAMANNSAKAVSTLGAMQQTIVAYNNYSVDHKDQLLHGYLPGSLYGQAVTSELNGVTLGGLSAQRYPTRLAEYQGDSWELIYNHTSPPEIPSQGDPDFSIKAYALGVNPSFGINATFVGGDQRYRGFAVSGGVNKPNPLGPAVFKLHRVKAPSGLIALAESREYVGGKLNENGFHTVSAPINEGVSQWYAEGEEIGFPSAFGGVGTPSGRFVNAAATGFIDGHSEALKPAELEDMRLWSNYAKTADDPALYPN